MANNLPNIKALSGFRLKGRTVNTGQVVSKSNFAKTGEWQNLCAMSPARAEETAEAVTSEKAKAKAKAEADAKADAKAKADAEADASNQGLPPSTAGA